MPDSVRSTARSAPIFASAWQADRDNVSTAVSIFVFTLRRQALSDTPLNVIHGTALTDEQKKDLLHRLARVEGQIRGVQKLIVNAAVPADCEGVAQQLAAARKALDRAFITLLTDAIVTHTAAAANPEQVQQSARNLAALLDKFA
jgi:DNA-binding FrmR family transcriptional regulator